MTRAKMTRGPNDSHRTSGVATEKPGPERIRFLLDKLGRPEESFPAIHVAGTNGKGSTCAFIASLLGQLGLRVGMFTSPHLIRYNERIVVDGEEISDDELAALGEQAAQYVEEAAATPSVGKPTEFEVATAVAFAHFAQKRVDVAVVEVGLGGRLDSTNVVKPAVSVITPIDIDHAAVLGTTLAEIAAEKAGIMRSGVPTVVGMQPETALHVIRRRAEALHVPLYEAGRDFGAQSETVNERGTTFHVRVGHESVRNLHTPLVGAYQADNAAVALMAAGIFSSQTDRHVSEEGPSAERSPSKRSPSERHLLHEDVLRAGLTRVVWPGRFETIMETPLTFVDGAHNVRSAQALAATLEQVAAGRKVVLVLGMLAEKPVEAMLHVLLPLADSVVFTRPRAGRTPPLHPDELARVARARAADGEGVVHVEEDSVQAVAKARRLAGRDGIVVVGGSLYLVGDVKAALAAGELQSVGE